VTKSELLSVLKDKLPEFQQKDVELALNCMFTQMENALVEGQRIEIRGFGSFDLHRLGPRLGRNPKTGETIKLQPRTLVHFKPGKEMKNRVNASRDKCKISE
jgi:integration host factor subunit beta